MFWGDHNRGHEDIICKHKIHNVAHNWLPSAFRIGIWPPKFSHW